MCAIIVTLNDDVDAFGKSCFLIFCRDDLVFVKAVVGWVHRNAISQLTVK